VRILDSEEIDVMLPLSYFLVKSKWLDVGEGGDKCHSALFHRDNSTCQLA